MYGLIKTFQICRYGQYLNIYIKCDSGDIIIEALNGIINEKFNICNLQLINVVYSKKSELGSRLELELYEVIPYIIQAHSIKIFFNNFELEPMIKEPFTRHSYLEPINDEILQVHNEITILEKKLKTLKEEKNKIKIENSLNDDRKWASNLRCDICGNVPHGAVYLNIGCKIKCGLNKRYCIGCVQDKYVKSCAKSVICSCGIICTFGDKIYYVDHDCNMRLDEVYGKVLCSRGCGKLLAFSQISNHILRDCVNVNKKICSICNENVAEDSLWLYGHGCDLVH